MVTAREPLPFELPKSEIPHFVDVVPISEHPPFEQAQGRQARAIIGNLAQISSF